MKANQLIFNTSGIAIVLNYLEKQRFNSFRAESGQYRKLYISLKSGTPGTASYREIISDSAKLIIGDSSADSKLDFGSIGAQNNNDTGNEMNLCLAVQIY